MLWHIAHSNLHSNLYLSDARVGGDMREHGDRRSGPKLLALVALGCTLTLSACADGNSSSTGASGESDTSGGAETTGSTETGDTQDSATMDGGGTDVPVDTASCDPFAQDCAEGEKCVAYNSGGGTWDDNKCVPINGNGEPGEPCVLDGYELGTDDCGASSYCFNVDSELMGTCTAFCQGSPQEPSCPGSMECSITNDGTLNMCIQLCDPLLQDCPNPDEGCYLAAGNFVCSDSPTEHPTGSPCGFIDDCAGGNICISAMALPSCEGDFCCSPFCDLSADAQCPVEGTECAPLFDMPDPGEENIGICALPS